jgi:hypothetical protein
MISLLNAAVASQGTGQVSKIDGLLGPVVNYPHGQYAYNQFPIPVETPTSITFGVIFRMNTSIGTANRLLDNNGQSTASADLGFNATPQLGIGISPSSYFFGPQLTAGGWYFCAASYKQVGGQGVVNDVIVDLKTGAIVDLGSVTGSNVAPGATTNGGLSIGGVASFADSSSSQIAAAMYSVNSFLTVAQLAEWARNPWDFWYPQTAQAVMAAGLSGSSIIVHSGAGEADGSASVSGTGYSTTGGHGTGNADGTSSVSGGGAALGKGAGEADGQASVSGGGGSTSGAGHADGQAAVSGASRTVRASGGAADGTSSVSGVGRSAAHSTGHADGQASVAGTTAGPSAGEADGQASVSGGGAATVGAAGHADGQASVHGSPATAGPFFFAWADPSETTFGPQHQRVDTPILRFKREWKESQCAILEIEIPNPFTGLLASGRQQWAWFSYRKLDTTVVPLFFGRLVSIPADMESETVTLHFTAQPLDMLNQKRAIASTLMVRPYYDPVWVREERRLDPDEVLEGYSAAWHVDPVSLTVTTSDYITGEAGTVTLSTSDVLYDNFKTAIGKPPLKSVYVNSTVNWVQYAVGTIDMGGQVFNAISGAGLLSSWPKAGTDIGSGWSVKHAQAFDTKPAMTSVSYAWNFENKEETHHFDDVMNWNSNLSASSPGGYFSIGPGGLGRSPGAILEVTTDEKSVAVEGDEDKGIAASGSYTITKQAFYGWSVKTMLVLNYEAKRQRTENVRFILGTDLQPVFTDPGGTAANFSQDSEEIHLEGNVGIEGPYGNFRGEWAPNTQYYLYDLFTTGNGAYGWQVLRDHMSLPFFDQIGTAGAWQAWTFFDAGINFYGGGGVYYKVVISGNTGGSFNPYNPFMGQIQYVRIADPHDGPRLYVNVPNFRGNWVAGGEILVAGDMVYAPNGNMYRVALGHRTAATFDQFASDPTTGQLWYSLMLNPAPIGDLSRRSYFPQDRGHWSIENLLCRARAHIVQRSRPFEVSFDCQFEKALGITLRNTVNVTDHRLRTSGGSATGKVVESVLSGDGDRGTLIGNIKIACAVGNGGSPSSVTGTPEYCTNYVVGYQAYTGSTAILVTSDVGYSAPLDGVVDDGLIFPLTKDAAVVGNSFVTFSTAPNGITIGGNHGNFVDGVLTLASKAQDVIAQFQQMVAQTQSVYTLALLPVQNGPFAAEYDINVTPLSIPKQADLAIT